MANRGVVRPSAFSRHLPSAPTPPSSSSMSQLGWEAATTGFVNLASDVDVAVCRLHYYLQRMYSLKEQVESVWQPTRLRMTALEASFRAEVESYLVGVRQDAARLEAAQRALRRLLSSSDSGASPATAGESPGRPAAYPRHASLSLSLSPRQPLTTVKEESSRSNSDHSSRKEDTSPRSKRKQKKRSDKCASAPAQMAAELQEKLREVQRAESEELDTSSSGGSDGSAGQAGAATSSSASDSSSGGGDPGRGTPASDKSDSPGGTSAKSSQDLSIARVDLVTPRSTLEEIREHQAALYDHLQMHSQRMVLVASTRRRFSRGGFRRRKSPPALGQAFEDPRALQLAVEAAARELMAAREPLLSRGEALRRLAAAADEARPPQLQPQPQPQRLSDLPSLRPQPLPQLRARRRARLWRVLRSWELLDFWAALWDFVCSFCCCWCAYRPSCIQPPQPVYESTWLMRSPPRGYSTTRL